LKAKNVYLGVFLTYKDLKSNYIFTLLSFTFQAAQKSGRNAIAFDGAIENLNELSVKASAIARHHDTKFRPGIDGKILTML